MVPTTAITIETTSRAAGANLFLRAALAAIVSVSLLPHPVVAGDGGAQLYSATVVVTGRDNLAERARGMREALPRMLTRLTVDHEMVQRAIAAGVEQSAESYVTGYAYLDRKEGVQISDEQGTRERSFELTVHFDAARINQLVAGLGGSVWVGPRPEIGIVLEIDDGASPFLLTRDSAKGYGQRLALEDESRALAVSVRLPESEPSGAAMDEVFETAVPVKLGGHMSVTPSGYWNTSWSLRFKDVEEHFASAETTFDAAIAQALRATALSLAKH